MTIVTALDDTILVTAFVEGNEQAFKELVCRH